jgi:hypothetical protein
MSTSTALATGSPTTGRTKAAMVSLVGGAVAIALGRLMTTTGGDPAQRLHDAAGQDARLTASMLLAIFGFAGLLVGLLGVAAHVRGRGSVLATVGAGLAVVGCVAFSVLVSVDATTVAATHVDQAPAMQSLLHELDTSPAILGLTPFAVLGYIVGPFLVALAGSRAGFVPRWLPFAVLGCLLLQPVGLALGGPSLARVVDSVFQLVLVGLVLVLARATLGAATRATTGLTVPGRQPGTVAKV